MNGTTAVRIYCQLFLNQLPNLLKAPVTLSQFLYKAIAPTISKPNPTKINPIGLVNIAIDNPLNANVVARIATLTAASVVISATIPKETAAITVTSV